MEDGDDRASYIYHFRDTDTTPEPEKQLAATDLTAARPTSTGPHAVTPGPSNVHNTHALQPALTSEETRSGTGPDTSQGPLPKTGAVPESIETQSPLTKTRLYAENTGRQTPLTTSLEILPRHTLTGGNATPLNERRGFTEAQVRVPGGPGQQRLIPWGLREASILPSRPGGHTESPQLYYNTQGRVAIYPGAAAYSGPLAQSCQHRHYKQPMRYKFHDYEEKRCIGCMGQANLYQKCGKCEAILCKYCMAHTDGHHSSMNAEQRRLEKESKTKKKNEFEDQFQERYEKMEIEEHDRRAQRLIQDAEAAERAEARKRERDDEDEVRRRRRRT